MQDSESFSKASRRIWDNFRDYQPESPSQNSVAQNPKKVQYSFEFWGKGNLAKKRLGAPPPNATLQQCNGKGLLFIRVDICRSP